MSGLYAKKSGFKIIIGVDAYYVDEPIGWNSINIILERDLTYFGFSYDFVEDSNPVRFSSKDVAYTILQDLKEEKGSDALAYFEFGNVEEGVFVTRLRGLINLNKYIRTKKEISVSIDKLDFNSDFRTKYETKIDLTAVKSLDESVVVVPPSPINISLHSKAVLKQFKSDNEIAITANTEASRFYSVKFDTTQVVTSELEGNQNLPLSVNGINPVDQQLYFFKVVEGGEYRVHGNVKFTFTMGRLHGGTVGAWNAYFRLRVFRGGAAIYDFLLDTYSGGGGAFVTTPMDVDFDESGMNLQKDDVIYAYMDGAAAFAGASYVYGVLSFFMEMNVVSLTDAPPTVAKGYAPFDVITKLVEYSTNKMIAVQSDFLQTGFGAKLALIYGFSVRGYTPEKPFITSIKDFIESMHAVNCLGVGFKNIAGVSKVMIEPAGVFFGGERILTLNEVKDFKEETATDFIYNDIEIGYAKYGEGEVNSLDEFNTVYNWLTSIRSFKSKFTKICKYITSGYSLEKLRREQFKDEQTTSTSEDDDIYIVSTIERTGADRVAERDENFDDIEGLLSPETSYNLVTSPLRMFWCWFKYLLIGVDLKPDTDLIKNTFIKSNDKFISTSTYAGADRRNEPTGPLVEKENITLLKIRDQGEPFHKPVYFTFEAKTDYDTVLMLRSYLTGETGEEKDHGFITHPTDQNVYWDSHIYKITFNPHTSMAQFKVAPIKEFE